MKPTALQKGDGSVKSINGQGNKADGPTKSDRFVKSINGQGHKADGPTKVMDS